MQKITVFGFGLESMADGVSQIQDTAQIAFPLVGRDDFRLQAHRFSDHVLNRVRITTKSRHIEIFHSGKQIRLADDTCFQGFIKPGTKFAFGQGGENARINQNSQRLVERSDKVLATTEIYAGLAADGGIHLRLHGGGNLDNVHTAHIDGGKKAGNISNHASTEGKYDDFAVGAKANQLFRQLFQAGEALVAFSIVHFEEYRVQPGPLQRSIEFLAPEFAHRGNGDNKKPLIYAQQIAKIFSRPIDEAGLDNSFVSTLRRGDWDSYHECTIIAYARFCALRRSWWYIFKIMKSAPAEADFLVIGAGVAGLRAAIELAPAGKVLVLAKQEITDSNSQWAQGGIAAALSDEDEIGLHLQDTLVAGDGLCNEEAVKVLVGEGPQRIEELIQWGTEFDRNGTRLAFGREGAHSRNRILHAHGDSTGREIVRALYAKAKTLPNVSVCEFEFSTDLVLEGGRVTGVHFIGSNGTAKRLSSSAVLLATGGLGQLYRSTTNPTVATGDGVAMAFRAGAEISDMEFVQFHPTALYLKKAPRFLLSEALRGEGAFLRNGEMHRFMQKYHPMAELAPRDVVARAIVHELEVSRMKDPVVYLDLTHLDAAHIRARFPRIYSTCMEYNIDITTDLIPIRPAAHYAMGGVRTDFDGKTSVPGLYAAGEAAATGVHGANRLASNSLLEGLVFGARAGAKMREEAGKRSPDKIAEAATRDATVSPDAAKVTSEIQDLMWREVGIVRTGKGLKIAVQQLAEMRPRVAMPHHQLSWQAHNLLACGLLVAKAALAREESRGAHYRLDFPDHNDAKFLKHSVITGEKIRFV